MASFLRRARTHVENAVSQAAPLADQVKGFATDIAGKFEREMHSHTHWGHLCATLHQTVHNQYHSFAPPRTQCDAKWYVDGCSYFYAMSIAIEQAHSQIWIMDWWLSPELYLRRPPSRNEQYRLDNMLKAAAERGVKVNIMVYKEVEKVLSLASIHTKHHLEALHPNIAVFRHPDHNPSTHTLAADFKNLWNKGRVELAKLPSEGMEALYGFADDVVLYWAHHEKLCLIDGKIAFMGGLDACFGRWDTNQHQIADAHPADIKDTIFPGQDYNNARVFDFQNIEEWDQNKLDRTKDARMGWSDLSISLEGPVIEDLGAHFVQRWNFIYDSKYTVRGNSRYQPLSLGIPDVDPDDSAYHLDGRNRIFGTASHKLTGQHAFADPEDDVPQPAGAFPSTEEGHHHHRTPGEYFHQMKSRFRRGMESFAGDRPKPLGVMNVQLVRSCGRWSHGVSTEHSIANAYIEIIENSQHFVYIENQFFITATDDEQHPIANKIGAAIVDRIVKAASNGEKYKVIVLMPAVPAFAGDLHDPSSLGTLAIMNFQYRSICRGGYSIVERIKAAGLDPAEYIRFYNLRNYDRINNSATMARAEQESGVKYEEARKQHDDIVGAGYDGRGERTGADTVHDQQASAYRDYQQAAPTEGQPLIVKDTVSGSYMLNGEPITSAAWEPGNEDEVDSFVCEELYIHSKVLIADDRICIIGSANLNDRSQLGYHDSEIAVVIQDTEIIPSAMNGQPYQASKFATSLRRQLFRKHLGLVPPQDPEKPDQNYTPITQDPNVYDWGSEWDLMVQDPLSPKFENLWTTTAANNTWIFERVFRPVPSDMVHTWEAYQDWYGQYYVSPSPPGTKDPLPAPYRYGHVFKRNFPGGAKEVKEALAGVRGTLVEMPLGFLSEVRDLVREGVGYNVLTEEIYT